MERLSIKELCPELTNADLLANEQKHNVSKAIYFKRKELNMSQKEFSEYMGVSQGMVSKWESFSYNFTIEAMAEICTKLNLTLEINLTGDKFETEATNLTNELGKNILLSFSGKAG